MEDSTIIDLFWARDPRAIDATDEKYGSTCAAIARNILGSAEDVEECVNDVYLRAWNAIPPRRPRFLGAFLGKITRNLALNRYAYNTAVKRGGGETELIFDELAACVSGRADVEAEVNRRELSRAIDDFLAGLPAERRMIFVCRYWYFDSIADIAASCGRTESSVAVALHRLRSKLRAHLSKRGFMP